MAATNRSKELKAAKMKAANNVHPLKDEPWKRGSSLDMPPAKNGHDQRWIRFMVGNVYDTTNYSRKIQLRCKQFQKNGNLCPLLAAV